MPGSVNTASAVHLPSAGGTGMSYGGDHIELPYARVSIQVFIWSGVNFTVDALPR